MNVPLSPLSEDERNQLYATMRNDYARRQDPLGPVSVWQGDVQLSGSSWAKRVVWVILVSLTLIMTLHALRLWVMR